jgi:hypothetical protein
MSEATRKQGQIDGSKGAGQRNPNEFKSDQDRKDYQAAYEKTTK